MAYTNTDTNMTTSSGLSAGMQTYYNRELLRTFEPNLVHLQFGDEHRTPPHSGLVMNMRKLIPLETNTKALSEGDPGESVMLAEAEVNGAAPAVRRIRALHGQARSDAFGHGHHAPHEAVWRRGRAKHRRGGARGAGEVRKRDLRGRQGEPRRTDGGGQADQPRAAQGGQDAQEEPRPDVRRLLMSRLSARTRCTTCRRTRPL